MKVFNTDMDIETFVFVILELIMLLYQILFYLQKPYDKKRYYYVILLTLYIIYNICGGLFPDPSLKVPIVTQNILAYGSGFILACYFPYYFYKAFNLTKLRFHATYGVLLFLFTPFLLFIVAEYLIEGNIHLAVEHGVIIPFFYAVIVLTAILNSIRVKYKEDIKQGTEMYLTYFAVVPWVSMPIISFFNIGQFIEVLVMNGGFLIISGLFIWTMIKESIADNERLESLIKQSEQQPPRIETIFPNRFDYNVERLKLSPREIEVALLIIEGLRYEDIAQKLFIAKSTVTKHVQNIFLKTGVQNKAELIKELNQEPDKVLLRRYTSM